MQNGQSFTFETYAAINSRSATDQADWPRMAAWVSTFEYEPYKSAVVWESGASVYGN
jgi:hypothetical protein